MLASNMQRVTMNELSKSVVSPLNEIKGHCFHENCRIFACIPQNITTLLFYHLCLGVFCLYSINIKLSQKQVAIGFYALKRSIASLQKKTNKLRSQ